MWGFHSRTFGPRRVPTSLRDQFAARHVQCGSVRLDIVVSSRKKSRQVSRGRAKMETFSFFVASCTDIATSQTPRGITAAHLGICSQHCGPFVPTSVLSRTLSATCRGRCTFDRCIARCCTGQCEVMPTMDFPIFAVYRRGAR